LAATSSLLKLQWVANHAKSQRTVFTIAFLLFLVIGLIQQTYADSFSASVLTTSSSTSSYARDKNAFYVSDSSLAGECTWYAYGRVIELAEKGELGSQAATILHDAFWGKTGRNAKNWPSFIGGTWTCTNAAALPVAKRHKGMLAVWNFGTFGHVAFVEEVSSDLKQYRISDFNYTLNHEPRTIWLPFEGNDKIGGVYPCFYELPIVSKPTAPSTMSAATTSSSATISWNDNSSNETGFNLYRYNGSAWTKIATLGANTTSYTDSGLTANLTYYYAVEAYNSSGTAWTTFGNGYISAITKPITATKPTASSSMSVSTTSDSVNVSWSDNSTNETGFNLYRWNGSNWINIATLGANVTSYANTGLSPNTTYYYAVEAYNAAGAAWTTFGSGYISAITKALTVSKPIAPSSMSVTTTSTSVNVSWSDNSTNEAGFNLYKWSGSGWTNIATLGANVTSYTNTGLTPNTTYYYAVEAYNNGGTAWTTFGSGYISAITKAVSDTKPTAPSSMSVSTTTNSVSVFWNDNSSNELGFNLYRWSGSTWTKIATLGINSTSYTDTGLASGVTYYYAVQAYNNIGAAWTTFGSGYVSAITATLGKPNAPSSMSVSTTSNSANVSWSDNSTNESGFYLYRWNGSTWIKIVTLGANVTSYTNTGLTSKLTYYYAVEAYNTVGSAWTTFGSGYISALTK